MAVSSEAIHHKCNILLVQTAVALDFLVYQNHVAADKKERIGAVMRYKPTTGAAAIGLQVPQYLPIAKWVYTSCARRVDFQMSRGLIATFCEFPLLSVVVCDMVAR